MPINPILEDSQFTRFSAINLDYINETVNVTTEEIQQLIAEFEAKQQLTTDDILNNFSAAYRQFTDRINKIDTLQRLKKDAIFYNDLINANVKQEESVSSIFSNQDLNNKFKNLQCSKDYKDLEPKHQAVIDHFCDKFASCCDKIKPELRASYNALEVRERELGRQFRENNSQATAALALNFTDPRKLVGIPGYIVEKMARQAKEAKVPGFTALAADLYLILDVASDVNLRKQAYELLTNLNTPQGDARFDNSKIMQEILQIRLKQAQMQGYKHYSDMRATDFSLTTSAKIETFLRDICSYSKGRLEDETEEVESYAASIGHSGPLQAWDFRYYSNLLRSQEFPGFYEARKYFELDAVINGLSDLITTMYGVSLQAMPVSDAWHETVRKYAVIDSDKKVLGYIMHDPYARAGKNTGAWMSAEKSRWLKADGTEILPVSHVVTQIVQPPAGEATRLEMHDVVTVFHEFGHALQHVLIRENQPQLSSNAQTQWDLIEYPSQFMEQWALEPKILKAIGCHFQTKQPIPDDVVEQLRESKQFLATREMVDRAKAALIDILLHRETVSDNIVEQITQLQTNMQTDLDVRKSVGSLDTPYQLTHVFDGGYAAAYYVYLYSEAYAADAKRRIKSSDETLKKGQQMVAQVFAPGYAMSRISKLYKEFAGEEPNILPLLEKYGVLNGSVLKRFTPAPKAAPALKPAVTAAPAAVYINGFQNYRQQQPAPVWAACYQIPPQQQLQPLRAAFKRA